MKFLLICSVSVLSVAPILSATKTQSADARPEHAVIFVIDGLSYKAVDRLPLNNLKALIARGTYYEKSYNIIPAHPKTGEWARYHSSAIPNPVILAGTVLLRPDQQFVQHSFFPARLTAHAANDIDYQRLNVGFNLTFMYGSDDKPAHDDLTIAWAIRFLREAKPAFMKVHLQDTGNAGAASYESTDSSVSWHHNIWAEGSPYTRAALKADEYLGRFLEELKAQGLEDKTLLFVTADHGQSDKGSHPSDDRDGWAMPLVVVGPGIRAGQRLSYAEQTDIVPTLCYRMGVKPPANADGRILAEALVAPPGNVPPEKKLLPQLNAVLVEGEAALNTLREDTKKTPALRAELAIAERDFYGIERILQWQRFGTVERLIAHDRGVLQKMTASHGIQ